MNDIERAKRRRHERAEEERVAGMDGDELVEFIEGFIAAKGAAKEGGRAVSDVPPGQRARAAWHGIGRAALEARAQRLLGGYSASPQLRFPAAVSSAKQSHESSSDSHLSCVPALGAAASCC